MKRLLVVLTAVSLLFSCIFCVSAAGVDDRYKITELLNSDTYTVSCLDNGKVWSSDSYLFPSLYVSSSNYAKFSWDARALNTGASRLYLTFKSTTGPQSVYFTNDTAQGTLFDGFCVSSSYNEGIYQYRFDIGNAVLSNVAVTVNFGTVCSAKVELMSFRAFSFDAVQLTSASYSNFTTIFQRDSILDINVGYGSGHSFPIKFLHEQVYADNSLFQGRSFLYISADQRQMRYVDSVILYFKAIDDNADISVSLVDTGNGNRVISNFPFTFERIETRYHLPDVSSGNSYQWPLSEYCLNIDTSGFDLHAYSIQVCVEVLPFTGSAGSTLFVQYDSCYMIPPDADLPWYKIFFGWIRDELRILGDGLSDIVDSLSPTSDVADEQKDAMEEDEAVIEEYDDLIATIPIPDLEEAGVDWNFDYIINPVGGISPAVIFNAFVGPDNFVVSLMTVVFGLALAAYIIFGGR